MFLIQLCIYTRLQRAFKIKKMKIITPKEPTRTIMDIQNLYQNEFFYWFNILVLAFLAAIAVRKLFAKNKRAPLPPGPRGLPVLGSLLQLGSSPPRQLYALAKKYGPLMTLKLGTQLTIVATSPAMAEQILKKHDGTLSGRPSPHVADSERHVDRGMAMLQMGPRWRMLKKISVTNLFSVNKLESLSHLRSNEVRRFISRIYESSLLGAPVDIKQATFVCAFNFMTNTIFGEKMFQDNSKELKKFQEAVRETVVVIGLPNLADHFPILRWLDPQGLKRRSDKAFGKLYEVMEKAVEKRLSDPNMSSHKDLLATFLEWRSQELTNWVIVGFLSEMFGAATDTIGTTVQWTLAELMRNPQHMKKCREEIEETVGSNRMITEDEAKGLSYLKAAVKEAWRLHPPGPFIIPRKAREDTVLYNGYLIPKGAHIFVNTWGIGHDPAVWNDPETFNPERFITEHPNIDYKGQNFELLPFGSGRRMCTGMPMAIVMTFHVLASLIQSFEWSLPPNVHDIDMRDKFGLVVEMATPLIVIPKARLPTHVY